VNTLETKATELAELAKSYGLDPKIQVRGDWLVYVDYTHNLHSAITFTDTGRVSVKSWERFGRKSESVSLKSLDSYLRYAGEQKKEEAKKDADSFISDHIKIISVF
jgi:hypothetical protein